MLEIVGCSEDPVYIEGAQTTIDALYDTQMIHPDLYADQVSFEFYATDPKTGNPHSGTVTGSLYAMLFDRISFA